MILQRIAYPNLPGLEDDLYVRRNRNGVTLLWEEKTIHAQNAYEMIRFDTYFNAFSLKKWKKYTKVKDVALQIDLKGKARVMLASFDLQGEDMTETILSTCIVDSDERKTFTFNYPPTQADMITFYICPLSDELFVYEGAYITAIDEKTLSDVNLALAICTYKREEYIANNLNTLRREVFDNTLSFLHGHLKAYISDNGNTLDISGLSSPCIFIAKNKNSGGAGGFSRSAITAVNDKDFNVSHVILMDDDIAFEIGAIERTYSFLRLIKKEYETNIIGGAMLRSDYRFVLHAAGEEISMNGITNRKGGLNLFDFYNVLKNEREGGCDYFAWWYSCISAKHMASCGYAIPVFFQFDDIEFGLRNKDVPKITLNGVCCWHLPFDKKISSSKNYYSIRNHAIVNSLHFPEYKKENLKKLIRKECYQKIFEYSYKEANLMLLAVDHFLNGLSWLSEQDPSELNSKIMSLADHYVDVNTLPMEFDYYKFLQRRFALHSKKERYKRMLCLNGYLLPSNRETIVEAINPPLQYTYRAKRVMKYDVYSGKGVVVEKSYKQAFDIIKRLNAICRRINKEFDKIVGENKKAYNRVKSEEYWRNYLNF